MPSTGGGRADDGFERQLREVNEALLISSIHQHELVEQAQRAAAALRKSDAELRLQAEELDRFNRVAVGRESRMVELKREINELAQRLGEPPRYPLGLQDAAPISSARLAPRMEHAHARAVVSEPTAPLESIVCTEELARRRSRPPDYQAENSALVSLMAALADSPDGVLEVVAQKIQELLTADSAGLSMLSPDGKRFQWSAVAGLWNAHAGESTPRDSSPCGDVLDRNAPLLLRHLERRYPYFQAVTPPIKEALFAPFYLDGKAAGALWGLAHGDREFDAEDLRRLQSLGRFASLAYSTTQARVLELSRHLAALNVMEDALQSRQVMQKVNRDLRTSEERYRSLFNSIDEGFCVVEMIFDSDGTAADYRFLEVNPAFEKQCGLHDVVGKRMRELAPQHESHWFERYGHVALTGQSSRFVDEAHALDGRWFDVYAFRIEALERRRVAILFTDITERRRLENKTQEQARLLAELNRRKDEFLAMLSHELRNPLASIANAAQLMRLRRDPDPRRVEAQGIIDRQVLHLARLVDDLLDVSRISTGRIRLKVESVDLREIVHRAVEAVRPQADQQRQLLTESLPDESLWVHGDAVRLEQVVVNLLNNANKYTDQRGRIGVTLQEECGEAVLRVRDNGVGITPEVLPHVFDWFMQADQSLDRAQGGLGVGLALVQSLVTLHGGRVDAYSTHGQGSEFVVTLPVVEVPQDAAAVGAGNVLAAAHALRVLVVDDNADAAQSVGLLLQTAGYDARLAYDGASAMRVAREFAPDVVLLDIGLPVVDGFRVARWIRQEPALRNVLLVALTGYGQDSDRERTAEAGFDYHLVKPANLEKLESILSTAVRAPESLSLG